MCLAHWNRIEQLTHLAHKGRDGDRPISHPVAPQFPQSYSVSGDGASGRGLAILLIGEYKPDLSFGWLLRCIDGLRNGEPCVSTRVLISRFGNNGEQIIAADPGVVKELERKLPSRVLGRLAKG